MAEIIEFEQNGDPCSSHLELGYFSDSSCGSESSIEQSYFEPIINIIPQNEPLNPTNPSNKSKKRTRNIESWKRNVAKMARLKGLPYESTAGKKNKIVEGRKLKPACTCPRKCYEKIPETVRKNIFKSFWDARISWEEKRQFIISMIKEETKKRCRPRNGNQNSRRTCSKFYSLEVSGKKIPVCKVMFMNTVNVSDKFVRTALDKSKSGDTVLSDNRGRHRPKNKVPDEIRQAVVTHINEVYYLGQEVNITLMYRLYVEKCNKGGAGKEDMAKEWYYRKVFHEEFGSVEVKSERETEDSIC